MRFWVVVASESYAGCGFGCLRVRRGGKVVEGRQMRIARAGELRTVRTLFGELKNAGGNKGNKHVCFTYPNPHISFRHPNLTSPHTSLPADNPRCVCDLSHGCRQSTVATLQLLCDCRFVCMRCTRAVCVLLLFCARPHATLRACSARCVCLGLSGVPTSVPHDTVDSAPLSFHFRSIEPDSGSRRRVRHRYAGAL